jgi:2-methylfumaryl-CoA isomerase
MTNILQGLVVVEASSFVAAPSAGLYLAQLGATVVRIDQLGGGPDFRRWPLAPSGASLYWENLNAGKRSVALDLGSAAGRDLLCRLATAPGADLFLTNFPVDGFLSYDRLRERRADLVSVRVMGHADGSPGLDYTVNAALGFPQITGPVGHDGPVNHVLPAWDLLSGAYAAFAALAALRHREATGTGTEVRVPLADIGLASAANLGMVAETLIGGQDRPRYGNAVYGAFGRDFATADGVRVMLVAITQRQWAGLVEALGIGDDISALEGELGLSFDRDEGLRFAHRDRLNPIVERAMAVRMHAELAPTFDRLGVCHGRYGSLHDALAELAQGAGNPLLAPVLQPSGERYPVAGAPGTFTGLARCAPQPAPHLGQDGPDLLAGLLGLGTDEIARLQQQGVVG